MDKILLRQALRARRQALAAGEIAQAAELATARLLSEPSWRMAQTIALHLAIRGELPTAALITAAWKEGKRVALPRMSGGRMEMCLATVTTVLVPGAHGIPEPPVEAEDIKPSELDLVLAPGVAFDRLGGRLGQGGGDYDRLLSQVRPDCFVVGWCHDFQLVDLVPSEPHDQRVGLVVTPTSRYLAAR